MKKLVRFFVILAIVLLVVGYSYRINSLKNINDRNTVDDSFNFSLRYNVNGDDMISTFDNTCTVHTVDGMEKIQLELSHADKVKILDKIKELNILNEDYSFLEKKYFIITPCGKYELVVEINSEKYTINWTSNNMPPFSVDVTEEGETTLLVDDEYKEDYDRLKRLFDLKTFIVNTLYEYSNVKALPEHIWYQ